MKNFLTIIAILVFSSPMVRTQDNAQTFGAIRLEDPASQGASISLVPPSGVTSYSLVLPASLPNGTWALQFTANSGSATGLFVGSPTGNTGEVAFFSAPNTMTGTPSLIWNADSVWLTSSSTARVGLRTSTPQTALDVNGDIAIRELNYTTSLSGTVNNIDFSGDGNRRSFVRVATTSSNVSLTGLSGGVNGKVITVYNASSNTIILKHLNASSATANRIVTPTGQDFLIPPRNSANFIYSSTDQAWITYQSSGSGTGSGGLATETNITSATTLPTSQNSYIRVTGGNDDADVNLEDGLYIGQIVIIENAMPGGGDEFDIRSAELAQGFGDLEVERGHAVMLVWNGTRWVPIHTDDD